VCQYLNDIMGVDFTVPNHGGNTPLSHAEAFGRSEVVEWLCEFVTNPNSDDALKRLHDYRMNFGNSKL
jgi:ankyrin repeat protein